MKKNLLKKVVTGSLLLTTLLLSYPNKMDSVHAAMQYATEAQAFDVGKTMTGTIDQTEYVYYYSFSTDNTDSFYEFSLTNISSEKAIYYAIYSDENYTQAITSSFAEYKSTEKYDLAKLDKNKTYYVSLHTTDSTGSFNMCVTKTTDDVADTVDSAESFSFGQTVTKSMQHVKDVDYFQFTTDSTDSFYEFSFTNIDAESFIYYYIYSDKDCTDRILYDDWGVKNKVTVTPNMGKLEKNHTYYVKVFTKAVGKYKFSITKTTDDVADTADTAQSFPIGQTITKKIQNVNDVDYYKFTTDGTDSFYEFSFSNIDANDKLGYYIYADADCTEIVANYDYISTKNTHSSNLSKLEKNHTYYLKVFAQATGSYSFHVTKAVDDINDTPADANKLTLNKIAYWGIQNINDVDLFTFTTTDFEKYTLTFANIDIDENVYIEIYSSKDCLNNEKVYNTYLGKKTSVTGTNASLKLSRFKTYYVKVTSKSTGKYKLGVSATAPASAKVSKAGTKKVTIKWKKVARATGYEIYRAQGKNGKYKKIATIKKNKTVKYTDKKGLKKGKTYCYKIRAYKKTKGKTYYSAFSSIKSIKVK